MVKCFACQLIQALLRYDYTLISGFTADFDWLLQTNGLKKMKENMITYVRLGPKIMCAKAGEDWVNFVACEAFLNLLIKSNVVATSIKLT